MTKKRKQKLKVFQAPLGFYDTVVAAPSRTAALRAWGVHQDLFASGDAQVATDPKVMKTALAHPATLLRRPVGSNEPFTLEPAGLPNIPDAPKKRGAKAKKAKPRAKSAPPARPEPDRSELDAAEAALRDIDRRREREEGELRDLQDALDQKAASAQSAYVEARRSANARLADARRAYRKAGGAD
jgi:hypothetical protein